MVQNSIQADPVLQADILALDALFKRIAERGRKIRSQNNTAESDNSGKDALSARQDPDSHGKESNHG